MAETPSAAFARRFFEGTQKLIAHHLKKRDDRLAALEKRVDELETLLLEKMEGKE